MIPFQDWLLEQQERQGPIGDLAREVKDDLASGCLEGFGSPGALVRHIVEHHDSELAAQQAAYRAWDEYSRERSHSVVLFRDGMVFRVIGPMSRTRATSLRQRMLREAEHDGDTAFSASAIKTYPADYEWSTR